MAYLGHLAGAYPRAQPGGWGVGGERSPARTDADERSRPVPAHRESDAQSHRAADRTEIPPWSDESAPLSKSR